jgi:hypothetical protein
MKRGSGAISVAVIVPTPELLKQMLLEKPPCWTWAAFASVLVQRWAVLEPRKVAQVLGAPAQWTGELATGSEVAGFIAKRMRDIDDVVRELTGYLKTRTFVAAFGASTDERDANAVGIIQAANDLGDYYERLLGLAEECRRRSAPEQYAALVEDCVRFANQHVQDFGGFVDDVLEFLEDQQKRVSSGQGLIPVEYLQIT